MNELELELRRVELQKQNENLRRIIALRESYGLHLYRPHWKQHKFHISAATGRYGRTGNRFGKSEMGVAEDLAYVLGGRMWYKQPFEVKDGKGVVRYLHPGGANHPYVTAGIPSGPVKLLILCENWKKAKQVFTNRDGSPDMWGKIFRLLPREAVGKITRSTGGDIVQIEVKRPQEFGGGSSTITIDTVQSYKNSPQSAESADWDAIHVDEPCPQDMFTAHSRGLMDRAGRYWFTCTPLDEMWINDEFTPPGRSVMSDDIDLEYSTNVDGFAISRYIITGSIYDNPYRTDAGVAEFVSRLSEEDKQCRIYGYPLALAGTVYREFVYDEHVLAELPKGWADWHLPPKSYTVRVAWDVHGARKPQALLFVATAPTGEAFVYDELFYEPLIEPNAKLLQKKLDGRFCVAQLIDSRAMIKNPVTNSCDVLDKLAEFDLYFDPGSKDLVTGISETKERLKERGVATGRPTIFFSPKLTRTLYEFSHYVYDIKTNEPIDNHDDMMENLRRLVINGLEYVPPISDDEWSLRKRDFVISDPGSLYR